MDVKLTAWFDREELWYRIIASTPCDWHVSCKVDAKKAPLADYVPAMAKYLNAGVEEFGYSVSEGEVTEAFAGAIVDIPCVCGW